MKVRGELTSRVIFSMPIKSGDRPADKETDITARIMSNSPEIREDCGDFEPTLENFIDYE